MENEDLYVEDNLLDNCYFKLAFPEQNYAESFEYQKWKKSMIEIIGEKGKEFFCNEDQIVIFQKYGNNALTCPICHKKFYLCPYCGKIERNKCCFKSILKEITSKKNRRKYIDSDFVEGDDFCINFLTMFIPIISNLLINACIFDLLYLFHRKKDINYSDKLILSKTKVLFFAILYSFSLINALLYMILYYEIFIFLIIISLPFKLYPVKIIMGIIDPLI